MTDDDYELLELAARAIGAVGISVPGDENWMNLTFEDGSAAWSWNPLVHSDDAFHLAVDAGLTVEQNVTFKRACALYWHPDSALQREVFEPWGESKHAATRRVVVRAAAEIAVASAKKPA